MLIYRSLTGKDDASFCHKVTKALSEGRQLHEAAPPMPSMAMLRK